jgi:aminocarboxymuconate-semialdehyde decarboxylase
LKVIDVHTHMLNKEYLNLLKKHGGGYKLKKVVGGQTGVFKDGSPFMTLMPGMFDYELRIKAMDAAKVDIAIVTLTSPNVYWGSAKISLAAAQLVNDDMAARQRQYPQRIRFMCSLPWQHAKLAVAELKRACDELGAVGVMVLANIDGVSLTDKRFAPVWKEIDRRGLPVLVHPSAPPGTAELDVVRYNLIASVGFMFDTSLAVARMIFDGFFDRHRAGSTPAFITCRLAVSASRRRRVRTCAESITIRWCSNSNRWSWRSTSAASRMSSTAPTIRTTSAT